MGGDVQNPVVDAVLHLIDQKLDVDRLENPGGGGLEVVEEDVADHIVLIERLLKGRGVKSEILQDFALQKEQGDVSAVVEAADQLRRFTAAGGGSGQLAGDPLEIAQRRGRKLDRLPARKIGGEAVQPVELAGRAEGKRKVKHRVEQREGGAFLQQLRTVVIAQEGLQILPRVLGAAVVEHRGNDNFQGIPDKALLLRSELMIRINDHIEILHPKGEGGLLAEVRDAAGQLLAVAVVEAGDDVADQVGRLAADIPLAVHQQLVKESQGLHLLSRADVGEVLLEDVQVGAGALPVLFAAGRLQKIAEPPLMAQAVHDLYVVLHRGHGDRFDHLGAVHQRGFAPHRDGLRPAGQADIDPQPAHILLEVAQLGVDKAVAAALLFIHIVQLAQNDLKRLVERVYLGELPPGPVPALLDPEIGIDQHERFGRKILKLEIPRRVVGRDMPDARQPVRGAPAVGVVIVKIGNSFVRLASELADVVSRRRPRNKSRVNRRAARAESARDGHGDIMHPRDMLKGVKRGHLPSQAHQLIDEFRAEGTEKAGVLLPAVALPVLLLGKKGKVQQRVEGQASAFGVKDGLQHGKQEKRPRPVGQGARLEIRIGEKQAGRIAVGKSEPSFLRLGGQTRKSAAAAVEHRAAGKSRMDGKDSAQRSGERLIAQQGLNFFPRNPGFLQERLVEQDGAEIGQEAALHLFWHGFSSPAKRFME